MVYFQCLSIKKQMSVNVFMQMKQHSTVVGCIGLQPSSYQLVNNHVKLSDKPPADLLFSHTEPFNDKVRLGTFARISYLLGSLKNVMDGMVIHHYIVDKGLEYNLFLGSHLLHMYIRFNSEEDGFCLFANMSDRNVYSWNYIIQACTRKKDTQGAVRYYRRMQQEAVLSNKVTFHSVIEACVHGQLWLLSAQQMHACIMHSECVGSVVLSTAILKMYGKYGPWDDVLKIFNNMPTHDVVVWTTMISLFSEHKHISEAFLCFEQMQRNSVNPSNITFVNMLSLCAKHIALEEGQLLYSQIVSDFLEQSIVIENALLNMFAKCGNLGDAQFLFDKMTERNVITWTSMMTLYSQNGYPETTFILFNRMQGETTLPNTISLYNIITACACPTMSDVAKRVNACLGRDARSDVLVGTALVNAYNKFGHLSDVEKAFNSVSKPDLILCNALIVIYVQNNEFRKAVNLLENMQSKGLHPDKFTFSNILAACVDVAHKTEGEMIHTCIVESGMELDLTVGNGLVHMYSKFDDMDSANALFDSLEDRDVITWTIMIAANSLHGKAFHFFDRMVEEGILPDRATFISILKVCVMSASPLLYNCISARTLEAGFGSDVILTNALITLLGSTGNVEESQRIFSMQPERDIVSWNSMITVYGRNNMGTKALETLGKMISNNCTPNKVTFTCILSSCANEAMLTYGKYIHMWSVDCGFETDSVLGTAILTMYGRSGCLDDARNVFNQMEHRTVLTWNSMMAVCAQNGQGKEAIHVFKRMDLEKVILDEVSFLVVLLACCHAGLVDEGLKFFESMIQDYNIVPTTDHYACLMDLLGRAGKLDEAEDLIQKMPTQPSHEPFRRMLSACKPKTDVERGERVAKHVLELQSKKAIVDYVILSNIYSALENSKA